ncbi:MAG: non-homologous end-joining DNA ligase [Oligoflexia bacterium]|nr:non-homologous end-joining DNA ligase [Oligoflexia bacterium]
MARGESTYVRLDGKVLELTNLDKVLYPQSGFTKREALRYYARAAPVLLRHLRGRALTLRRFPDGVEGEAFYEKRCPSHRPSWMRTIAAPGAPSYCVVDDLAGLLWVANLACLELHTELSVEPDFQWARLMVFDLDPGAGAGITECCAVGQLVRERLAESGLECFAKTSGGKGLQLYVPLAPGHGFEETKGFSRQLAESFERKWPDRVVSRYPKRLREGKVLIDWAQNDPQKTTVCAYSLRAMSGPTVSTPVSWKEVEAAARGQKEGPGLRFEAEEVLARIERLGDLFAPTLELKQRLPRGRLRKASVG